jgi:V8-like Glu-specific endopeptidase
VGQFGRQFGVPGLRLRAGRRRIGATAAVAVIAVVQLMLGAPPTSAASRHIALPSQAGQGGFWTADRMRAADPRQVTKTGAPPAPVPPSSLRGKSARPFRVPPTEPSSGQVPTRADARQAGAFSSHAVSDPDAYPYTTNGAVFFRTGGGLASCSGTAVTSKNRSLVVTAGHCVHSGFGRSGRWFHRKWTFVPGLDDGVAWFGQFKAKALWTTDGWWRSENYNFDVGMAVLGRNALGQKLTRAVGSQGFATNLARSQAYDAYGYPADPPFDGAQQWVCESQYAGDDPNAFAYSGPPTLAIGCDMTAGSSGGGWVAEDQYVNGVNSYMYSNDPSTMYGPYFGTAIWRLYKQARKD